MFIFLCTLVSSALYAVFPTRRAPGPVPSVCLQHVVRIVVLSPIVQAVPMQDMFAAEADRQISASNLFEAHRTRGLKRSEEQFSELSCLKSPSDVDAQLAKRPTNNGRARGPFRNTTRRQRVDFGRYALRVRIEDAPFFVPACNWVGVVDMPGALRRGIHWGGGNTHQPPEIRFFQSIGYTVYIF